MSRRTGNPKTVRTGSGLVLELVRLHADPDLTWEAIVARVAGGDGRCERRQDHARPLHDRRDLGRVAEGAHAVTAGLRKGQGVLRAKPFLSFTVG